MTSKLKKAEEAIKKEWLSLSHAIRKDVANVWYDRSREEIKEIHDILKRISKSKEFKSFLESVQPHVSADDIKELIALFDIKEVEGKGITDWYSSVFSKLQNFLRLLHEEIKLLDNWVFRIERADESHVQQITDLFQRSYPYYDLKTNKFRHILTNPEEVRKLLTQNNAAMFIALYGNKVIGCAAVRTSSYSMYLEDPKVAQLDSVVTDHEFRGKGIARELSKARIRYILTLDYYMICSGLSVDHIFSQKSNANLIPTAIAYEIYDNIFIGGIKAFKDIKNYWKRTRQTVYIPDYHKKFFEKIYSEIGVKRTIKTKALDNLNVRYPDDSDHVKKMQFVIQAGYGKGFGGPVLVRLDLENALEVMNILEYLGSIFCGIYPSVLRDRKEKRTDCALYIHLKFNTTIPVDEMKLYSPLAKYIMKYTVAHYYKSRMNV